MKKEFKNPFKLKFVAVLVLISQFAYLLPAQTYISELSYDKQKFEYYLDRASRERDAEDWQRIAEEGIFNAMCEWESANTYLKETDYDKYLEQFNQTLDEVNKIANNKFAYWYTKRTVEQTNDINKSSLYYILEAESNNYKEQYKANGASLDTAEATRSAWEAYATNVIDAYLDQVAAVNNLIFPEVKKNLAELNISDDKLQEIFDSVSADYTNWATSEYENIYKAERNQLTAVLLYDTQSTKKLTAIQAAEAIARETAQEVKAETDVTINQLFNKFESDIAQIDGEDLVIAQKNWLNNFQKAFDESLQKWNDAEKEFLVKRSEWEYEAEELYAENEVAWAEGYKLLQDKKDEWFKEINEKLEKGRLEWNKSEDLLTKQLNEAKLDMQATYQKQRDTKSKLLDVQIGLYEQSRAMLNISAQGLTGFAESFEKYKNRYSYWKTEDAEDANIKEKIDELFQTIQLFKKQPGALFNLSIDQIKSKKTLITELTACCTNESVKADLNKLIATDSWIDYIITYKQKAIDAIEALYQLTGCVYNETKEGEITFLNELDIQLLKSKVTLEYWNEEYDVALAVKEYAQSHSSETETDSTTLENLNKAITAYEEALTDYNTTVSELTELLSTVNEKETGANGVNVTAQAMNKEKEALEELQKQYSEILVVFKGASTNTLIQKIASLVKEYDEIKKIDTTQEFQDYYDALITYNTEVLKTDLYTVTNNLTNGKTLQPGSSEITPDTKSLQELVNYKDSVSGFLTKGINYNSKSEVTSLREKISSMMYYSYDNVNGIISMLDTLEANKDTYTEVQKKQLQENINIHLKLILQFWQNEIDYRNDSLTYINTGIIAHPQKDLTEEDIHELTIRNYLSSIVEGVEKWTNNFNADFSNHKDLIEEIKNLLKEPEGKLLEKCKTACSQNESLQYLLKQQDIFETPVLMNWILAETEYKSNETVNKLQNKNNIVEFCSQYIASKVNINHSEAIQKIQEFISSHNYRSLSFDEIYSYINNLSELGTKLNIHGQTALSNYINGVIEYAGIKYAFDNGRTASSLQAEINNVNNQFKTINQEVNDLGTLSYSISDLNTVLGLIKNKNEIYTSNKDDFITYASYLIMSNLFSSDVKDKTANDLITYITSFTQNLTNEEKAKSWEVTFTSLSKADQNTICTKIINNYNYVKDYKDYKNEVQTINDYFYILQTKNLDAYNLYFINAKEDTVNSKIYQAEKSITDYAIYKELLKQYNDEIAQIQKTLNDSNDKLTDKQKKDFQDKIDKLNENITLATTQFKEGLSIFAKNNNWFNKLLENEDLLEKPWFKFFLADEKTFFIFLQSDYGYSYINEAKDKLTNSYYKAYLESLVKLNNLSFDYIDLLDTDVETWLNSIKEPLTAAEKDTLRSTLTSTGAITTYFNYEAVQNLILNSYGSGQFVNNQLVKYNNLFNKILEDKYNQKDEEFSKLQFKNAILNSALSAITSNNVTWAGELRNNEIGYTDFLDTDSNDAITRWVTNNNPVDTLLSEKSSDIQRHYNWLCYMSSIYNINVNDPTVSPTPGAEDSYLNLVNSTYAKLNKKVDTSGIINEICTVNNSLKKIKEDRNNAQIELEALSQRVSAQNTKYNNSIEAWKESVNQLKLTTEAYNQKVELADSKFTTLKEKEKEKRIAQEKYDYATSIYLKELGQINNADYISPEEKFVNIAFSRQQAQVTIDVLRELQNGYTANEEYTTAMSQYKTSVLNHYKAQILKQESDAAIAVQKDNVREADQAVQEAYAKVFMNPVNMKKVTPNMKLVSIQKDTNGNYSFSLAKDGKTCNEQLMIEYFTKLTVPEKTVDGERNITKAVYDTRVWAERLNQDRDYAQELMLASVYFKYLNRSVSLDEFSCNELPQGTIQGINCESLSKDYREEIFHEAYNSVMGRTGGESDLACYLIYVQDTTGVNGENNKYGTTNMFANQLQDAYKIRLLNKLIDYCEPKYDSLIIESVAFFAEAAIWGAAAASCPWPVNLIPAGVAAGFSIAAGTALYKANVIKNDLISYMKNKIKGLKNNISSSVKSEQDSLKDITTAKTNLATEWSTLNKMLNGVDSEVCPTPTYKLVQDAMKYRVSILANKAAYTTDINDVYTEAAFNAAGASGCETIADAINKMNAWYETQEINTQTNLAHVITKLQTQQNENTLSFANVVNENAVLSEEKKKQLHTLANKASDEKLSAEERDAAKKEFDELSTKFLTVDKTYKDKLKTLAEKTWGKGTWHSDVYYKDQMALAKSLYSENRINFSNTTELYTHSALQNYKKMVLASFDQAVKAQMEVFDAKQNKEIDQLATKRTSWENQMLLITTLAEIEWNKAGETLVSGYNDWKKKFIKEYNEKQLEWTTNYTSFLEKKENWVNEQFLYAVNVGNSEVLDNSGLDVESAISQALTQLTVDSISLEIIDPEKYTEELIAESSLNKLMNSVESLKDRGKNAAVTKKHGSKINATAAQSLINAQLVMQEMQDAIENAAARLAGEQAALLVEKSIEASMDRIDQENKGMRDWEISLVQANGYKVNDTVIERDAVIDSTIAGAIYSHQTVAFYQDFTTAKPGLTVSLSKTMLEGLDSSAIMLLVSQANSEIAEWNKSIFGDTTVDEDGNVVQKQYTVPRTSAEAIHKKTQKDYGSKYAENQNLAEKKEYDALVKKGYAYLTEEEKDRFDVLSSKLITVRDGELGEWIGYAPQFKDGRDGSGIKNEDDKTLNIDLEKDRDKNIKAKGSGQMGIIMLDFQWNSILEGQGWGKLAQPMYDQALWYAPDSWFQPPTLRQVGAIVTEVIGTATGQKWFSYADDLIFAAIDVGGGFKSPEEVGLQLAKTAAVAAVSYGIGTAGSAISGTVSTAMESASKFANFAAQAGITMVQTYATTVASSAINCITFDPDGNLTWDKDSFKKSLYSADTIAGVAGAGMTAGLNKVFDMNYKAQGDTGAMSSKLGAGMQNLAVSTASKLTEWSVYSAYALSEGRNVYDAFEDMGGYTFNIANLGIIADLIATHEGRTNATGQSGVWGKIADNLAHTGILEINVTQKGFTGKFGTGGFDLLGNAYSTAKAVIDLTALDEYATKNGISDKQSEAAYLAYIYGDRTQEDAAMRIAKGTDELNIVEKSDDEHIAHTEQKSSGNGRVITMEDSGNKYFNAIQLGHEAYRNGIVGSEAEQKNETIAAVMAHTDMTRNILAYSDKNRREQIAGNVNLVLDLILSIKDQETYENYINQVYDSAADFWKLMDNGVLVNDGSGWLTDERGNPIYNADDKQIGANTVETGLLNILFGHSSKGTHDGSSGESYDSFTDEQKRISYALMMDAKFTNNNQDGSKSLKDIKWTETNKGQKDYLRELNMNYLMTLAGDSVATVVFARYYNATADAQYVKDVVNPAIRAEIDKMNTTSTVKEYIYNNMKFTVAGKQQAITDKANARYYGFYKTKEKFYTSTLDQLSEYDQRLKSNYRFQPDDENCGESDNFHKANDKPFPKGSKLYTLFPGKTVQVDRDNSRGTTSGIDIGINVGYQFENYFISSGMQSNTFHLSEIDKNFKNNTYYDAGQYFGKSGNTGLSKGENGGYHVHTELYVTNTPGYDRNLQAMLLKLMKAPSVDSFTKDPKKWNNSLNFYGSKNQHLYINLNNVLKN